MSRCFPFPPPGYEKKPRSSSEQGEDLIAKEKHKDKKHKKEKKDKEKREGKERKDKDRSKDKHKEKKDRKEKHKDKKKDKDRDRDKDKSKTPEDRRTEHKSEVHHEGRLGHDSRKAEEVGHSKFTEELGRRIRDDERVATNRSVEDFSATVHRRTEGFGASAAMGKEHIKGNKMATDGTSTLPRRDERLTPSFQKKAEGMEVAATLEKPKMASSTKVPDSTPTVRRNENLAPGVETAVTLEKQKVASIAKVPDLTSTVRRNESLIPPVQKRIESVGMATAMEKQRSASNQKVGGFSSGEQRNHVTGRLMENLSGSVKRKIDGVFAVNSMQKERPTSNSMVPNPMGLSMKRNDGMVQSVESVTSSLPGRTESRGVSPVMKERSVFSNNVLTEQKSTGGMGLPVEKDRPAEKDTDKKHEGKEKTKEKKAEDGKREGHKDKDRSEKKRKEKDKDRHKDKKKEEKKREKGEHKHTKHNKVRENGMKDQIDTLNNKTVAPHIGNVKTAGADGNSKKRKELEINGFLHEPQYDGRPNKLPRTNASSSHSPVENERLEFSSIASICSIEIGAINNLKVEKGLENNGNYINGKAKGHLPQALVSSVHPVAVDSSKNDQLSPKLARELGPSVLPAAADSSKNEQLSPKQPRELGPSVFAASADSSKNEQLMPKLPQALGSSVLPLVMDSSKGDQVPPKLARPSVAVASSKSDLVPSRPPHPDNKYLSTIYSVPKMEELVKVDDDQGWLFSSGNPQPYSKLDAEQTPQVWAKGLQIEAADVFALPYVVPF